MSFFLLAFSLECLLLPKSGVDFFILAFLFVDSGGGPVTVGVLIAGASTAVVPQEIEEADEKAYGYGAADTGAKRLVA